MLKQPLFPPEKSAQEALTVSSSSSFSWVTMIYPPYYTFIDQQHPLALLNLLLAERWLRQTKLNSPEEGLHSQLRLILIRLVLNKNKATAIMRH